MRTFSGHSCLMLLMNIEVRCIFRIVIIMFVCFVTFFAYDWQLHHLIKLFSALASGQIFTFK